jgi:hypothetical protein
MRLEKASIKATRYALMNFHYAKAIPSVQSSYSVFNDNNEWCGVICYSIGANKSIGTFAKLPIGAVCELVRVALNGKQESTSKALAISLKLVKKNNPLLKLVVSYADMDMKHKGIIYQATNWYYLGETARGQSAFIINGRKTHNKTVHSRGIVESLKEVRKHLDPNATKFYSEGKQKYIYPLDKSLIPLCKSLSKPYPKNAVIAQGSASGFQPEDGVRSDLTAQNIQ